jgi:hypothetical protein
MDGAPPGGDDDDKMMIERRRFADVQLETISTRQKWSDWFGYVMDLALLHPLSSIVLFLASIAVNVIVGALFMRALNVAEGGPPADAEDNDNTSTNWARAFFNAAHVTADPGGLFDKIRASKGGESFIAVLVTLGGMVILAILVGGVSEVIAEKHRQLKRGRSKMMEYGHWVILGWNDKLPAIVKQISFSQSHAREFTVIVLNSNPNMDREEAHDMLQDLNDEFESPLKRIIVRNGSTHDPAALRAVNLIDARAIIVLSSIGVGEATVTDAPTLRTLLCILATVPPVDPVDDSAAVNGAVAPAGGAAPPARRQLSIVCEIIEEFNGSLFEALDSRVNCVAPRQLLGRLLVQTSCSHLGLASVYQELLSFDGSEFQIRAWPQVIGQPFEKLQDIFTDNCTVIGVMRPSEKAAGYPQLVHPDPDCVIQHGDQLVFIADGPDVYGLRNPSLPSAGAAGDDADGETRVGIDAPLHVVSNSLVLPAWPAGQPKTKRILIVGWRDELDGMLEELNEYVSAGSIVSIIHESPVEKRHSIYAPLGPQKLSNVEIEHKQVQTDSHADLKRFLLGVSGRQYSAVMILSDAPTVCSIEEARAADSKILMITVAVDALLKSDLYKNAVASAAAAARSAPDSSARSSVGASSSPAAPDPRGSSSALVPAAGAAAASSSSSSSSSVVPAHKLAVRVVSELSDVQTKALLHAYDPSVGEFIVVSEQNRLALLARQRNAPGGAVVVSRICVLMLLFLLCASV